MLKVVIVEDEDEAAEVLCSFLDKYAAEKNENIRYVRYKCTTDFLSGYNGADIVFMDINIMNDMNGIKAAHKLRQADSVVTLIFITSFEQFAVKGYEVEAFDFIVKPVSYPDFALRIHSLLVLLYTGMRRGELASMQIESENDRTFITCETEKTRKGYATIRRRIPISPMFHKVWDMIDFEKAKKASSKTLSDTIKKVFPERHVHELRYTFISRCNLHQPMQGVRVQFRA